MASDRLDNDRDIDFFRESIDEIDQERSLLMAKWIVSTLVKLDAIQTNQLSGLHAEEHWQPYRELRILTSRRDFWSDLVGGRKGELQDLSEEPITTNQEGRWQWVKLTYQTAAYKEASSNGLSKKQEEKTLEWMHEYTEYEHKRAKERQDTLRAGGLKSSTDSAAAKVLLRIPSFLPHVKHHHRKSA